jgi:hypothetical protein
VRPHRDPNGPIAYGNGRRHQSGTHACSRDRPNDPDRDTPSRIGATLSGHFNDDFVPVRSAICQAAHDVGSRGESRTQPQQGFSCAFSNIPVSSESVDIASAGDGNLSTPARDVHAVCKGGEANRAAGEVVFAGLDHKGPWAAAVVFRTAAFCIPTGEGSFALRSLERADYLWPQSEQ